MKLFSTDNPVVIRDFINDKQITKDLICLIIVFKDKLYLYYFE